MLRTAQTNQGMNVSEFKVNLRDIKFVLNEQLGMERILKYAPYSDFDSEDFNIILQEAAKFAETTLGPLNKVSDEKGVHFEDGNITFPREVHDAYKGFVEGGWVAVSANPEYGGMGLPHVMSAATGEMFTGACVTFTMTPGLGVSGAHLIETFGSKEMKDLYCEKMYTGKWAGTMCLTEAGAGSAVGDLICAADREGDAYKISGVKTFISSADHDLTENIIHLVLARIKGAPKGMGGVSLFLVPKFRVNADGSLGEFNDVAVGNIEHKMGIKGSPTCEVSFGANENCIGWLIGEEHRGIRAMFQMMNEARIGVGLQASSIASAAYGAALDYAKDRIQGVDITRMKDVDAPRVPIIEHPDVKRMLLFSKAYTEGMRALILKTAYYVDIAENEEDQAKAGKYKGLIEVLTPICKAYCSDSGFKVTEQAMQVFGGYGYCSEYPVEQYMRDIKITSIYEGTNGIQALDLLGRKVGGKGGMLFMAWVMEQNKFIDAHRDHEVLALQVKQLEEAKNTLAGTVMEFSKYAKDPMYPIQYATPLLEMFGEVIVGQLLIEQAVIAHEKLAPIYAEAGATDEEAQREVLANNEEAKFLGGKISSAAFFAANVLPRVGAKAKAIASGDRSVLNVVL